MRRSSPLDRLGGAVDAARGSVRDAESEATRRGRPGIALLVATSIVIAVPMLVVAADRFEDVPDSNIFHDDIGWLAEAGVTRGCNPPENSRFCPDDGVTRSQMAAFMRRLAENRVVDAATASEADHALAADSAASATEADHADSADRAGFVPVVDHAGFVDSFPSVGQAEHALAVDTAPSADDALMLEGKSPVEYATVVFGGGSNTFTEFESNTTDLVTQASTTLATAGFATVDYSLFAVAVEGSAGLFAWLQLNDADCLTGETIPGTLGVMSVSLLQPFLNSMAISTVVPLEAGTHDFSLCVSSFTGPSVVVSPTITGVFSPTGSGDIPD